MYYLPYLVFEQEHGRPPRADELSLEQRIELLRCLLQTLESVGRDAILRDAYTRVVEDPDTLNNFIAKMTPELGADLRKVAFERGYRPLAEDVLASLGDPEAGPGLEHFTEVMAAVGIPRREGHASGSA